MSFNPVRHPGVAVTNGQGNNLNTKVTGLRVMNTNPLTERQRMELEHKYQLHMANVGAAVGGYLVRNTQLSDGSRVRIESNSGMHQVMVWPVGGTVNLQELPWFVYCIPANFQQDPYVAPFGWRAPIDDEEVEEGENGIPAELYSMDVGAQFRVVWKKVASGPDLMQGKKLSRYKQLYLPLTSNPDPFLDGENNTSAQCWEHREWVAPDMRTCVTTYEGKIKVNGRDFDYPPGFSDTLWACIYFYEPVEGEGAKPHLFAVSILGDVVTASRRPLNDATWEVVATLDLSTLDATAASSWAGLPDARRWVLKVQANESRTTCTLWIQSPGSITAPDTARWVGYTDIDMHEGTVTNTEAAAESRHVTATYTSTNNGTNVVVTEWSGDRQIAFTYDGDDKVFTVLRFSGAQTITQTVTSGHNFFTETRDSHTDTRKVELVYDDVVIDTLYDVEVHTSTYDVTAADNAGEPQSAYEGGLVGEAESDLTSTTFQLVYYGGPGQTLAYRKSVRRVHTLTEFGIPVGAGAAEDHTTVTNLAATDALHVIVDDEAMALGERVFTGPGDPVVTGIGGSGTLQTWSTSGSVPGYDITLTYWNAADLSQHLYPNAHAVYDNYDSSDRSWMNTRRVRPPVGTDAPDFVIFSIPNPTTVDTPHDGWPEADPESFTQFCTDPDILDKINAPDPTGVLKGIRLK